MSYASTARRFCFGAHMARTGRAITGHLRNSKRVPAVMPHAHEGSRAYDEVPPLLPYTFGKQTKMYPKTIVQYESKTTKLMRV